MKKILSIPFLLSVGVIACKKDGVAKITPVIPPSPEYYSVAVDTSEFHGFGTAFPLSTKIKEGNDITITVTPNVGCRVGSVLINGAAFIDTTVIVLSNIHVKTTVKIRLTDSLTTDSIKYLQRILTNSTWHDRSAYWRGTRGSTSHAWQFLGNYSECQQADYYNFYLNGDYIGHTNVGPCNAGDPVIDHDSWQLSSNGKQLTFTHQDGTASVVAVDTLMPNKFTYIYIDWQSGGKDYKVDATP